MSMFLEAKVSSLPDVMFKLFTGVGEAGNVAITVLVAFIILVRASFRPY